MLCCRGIQLREQWRPIRISPSNSEGVSTHTKEESPFKTLPIPLINDMSVTHLSENSASSTNSSISPNNPTNPNDSKSSLNELAINAENSGPISAVVRKRPVPIPIIPIEIVNITPSTRF